MTSQEGARKPVLRFVPCKEGGFNLGNSQLAPIELCMTCDYFEGETEDRLGIFCSREVRGFSLSLPFRKLIKQMGEKKAKPLVRLP